ncbi:sporulation protein YunB [Virgibacillus necropolis]|uniref:Sporulation protein YunB n=1 Tax=Virgibacillus necropolis TaxID=163877 RepID=A0A221MB45_9BACI|nr:sporulation protein YunB [Virgibacillus necropolis]ASN04864.1 sporulation protein YunB [Virgibacillus necropolis]
MQPKKSVFRKKPRTPPPVKYIFVITCILFVAMVSFSIWFIGKKIQPPLMEIAEIKTTEFATRAINAAVKSSEGITFDNLVDISKDDEGNISMVSWSGEAQNKLLRKTTERAEYFLYNMNKGETVDTDDPDLPPLDYDDSAGDLAEKDPTVVEIPIGQAFDNTILANLGPRIPVNFEIVGAIQSDIVVDEKAVGINSVVYNLYVQVTVDVQIVVPFTTKTDTVSTKIYIDARTINSEVPLYYGSDGNGTPPIAIPKDDLQKEE